MAFFGRAALSDVPLRHGSRERSTMRKLLLAGIMTLALPVAAFAQTSGTTDTTAAPAATTAHKATHHTAHHRAHTAKHAKKHAHRKSSTTAAPSSNPVN